MLLLKKIILLKKTIKKKTILPSLLTKIIQKNKNRTQPTKK